MFSHNIQYLATIDDRCAAWSSMNVAGTRSCMIHDLLRYDLSQPR